MGIDIFTAKKYEETYGSGSTMDVPNVDKKEYTLIDITDEGFVILMNEDGTTKEDVKLWDKQEDD